MEQMTAQRRTVKGRNVDRKETAKEAAIQIFREWICEYFRAAKCQDSMAESRKSVAKIVGGR